MQSVRSLCTLSHRDNLVLASRELDPVGHQILYKTVHIANSDVNTRIGCLRGDTLIALTFTPKIFHPMTWTCLHF